MLPLLQAIANVLRPDLIQQGSIRLEEADPGSACRAITLDKGGRNAIVLRPDQVGGGICPRHDCAIRLDAANRLFPLFRLDAGIAVMCDYIVFCQDTPRPDARLFVLLCELKSGNVGGSRQQIENGRLLADYLLAKASHHGAVRSLPEIQRRGLVFRADARVPKGSLRSSRCAYEPWPQAFFQDLPVAHYACGAEYPLEHFCT